jgi:hypothetical protein
MLMLYLTIALGRAGYQAYTSQPPVAEPAKEPEPMKGHFLTGTGGKKQFMFTNNPDVEDKDAVPQQSMAHFLGRFAYHLTDNCMMGMLTLSLSTYNYLTTPSPPPPPPLKKP